MTAPGVAPLLDVAVVTLFPALFAPFLEIGFVKRARELGRLRLLVHDLRQHGRGAHRSVDDTPYGGGSGMVLRVDSVVDAMEAAERALGGAAHRVLLTPQGRPFVQNVAHELSRQDRLLLVAGRYEGFDERVRKYVSEEISLGDFILTGGEVAAMAILEAVVRLLPGVLGNAASLEEESFGAGLDGGLEYPQYTRPASFRGAGVPEVLRSGDHARVARWRREDSRERTLQRRPDLVRRATSDAEPSLALGAGPELHEIDQPVGRSPERR